MVKQLRGLARAFQNGEIAKGAFMEKSNVVLAQLTDTVVATERFDVVLPVMGYVASSLPSFGGGSTGGTTISKG